MNLFFIKDITTGYYMLDPKGHSGRGGSFMEPISDKDQARIFRSKRSAKVALGAWLRGKHMSDREYEDDYSYTVGYTIIPVEHRKREHMEIVEVSIILP